MPGSRIFAGEYPGHIDATRAREKIGALLTAGIESFIDLTEEDELNEYESLLRDEADLRGISVSYIRVPIRDLRVPTLEAMSRLQRMLADAERLSKTVYVHCWGGVGRTGTVIGCHLVDQGYSAEEALNFVQRLFREMSPKKLERHPEGSPETNAQREFVRQWAGKRSKSVDSSGDSISQPTKEKSKPGVNRPKGDGC